MRRIILNVAVSLDGYLSGPNGEYDWCFTDQDYGMKEFLGRIDATLIGRRTYDLMVRMGEPVYPEFQNYIFSKTISQPAAKHLRVVTEPLQDFVSSLKNSAGKDIWLFGGGELIQACMEHGIVDELLLAVHPIILGSGKPIFGKLSARSEYILTGVRSYSTGLVQLAYQRKEPA